MRSSIILQFCSNCNASNELYFICMHTIIWNSWNSSWLQQWEEFHIEKYPATHEKLIKHIQTCFNNCKVSLHNIIWYGHPSLIYSLGLKYEQFQNVRHYEYSSSCKNFTRKNRYQIFIVKHDIGFEERLKLLLICLKVSPGF